MKEWVLLCEAMLLSWLAHPPETFLGQVASCHLPHAKGHLKFQIP